MAVEIIAVDVFEEGRGELYEKMEYAVCSADALRDPEAPDRIRKVVVSR